MNQPPSASATFDNLNRRQFLQYASLCIGSSIVSACANSNSEKMTTSGLDKVTFGTNWLAQAEHGGFYQAIATGIYKNHGLDVTIKMGGPAST